MRASLIFFNVIEIDECIEEFAIEVNKAKAGLSQDNTREGVNVKFQDALSLERETKLKEG